MLPNAEPIPSLAAIISGAINSCICCGAWGFIWNCCSGNEAINEIL